LRDFEYLAAKSVQKACSLLAKHKDEAKVLAGGQSLITLMKERMISPTYVIDIKGISGLDYVKFDRKQGLRIGALTTHRTIETSAVIKREFPVLAEMEKGVHGIQMRNWGTIGGNLCHADPAGDPAPPLIALKAKVKIASSKGERTLALEEFFKGYLETALAADELLTEIQVANLPPHTGVAYMKFTPVEVDHGIVGTAVWITLDSKKSICKEARIVLSAVASVPVRALKAEKVLAGKQVTDNLIEEAAQVASDEVDPETDMNASGEYRRELVKVLVRRVSRQALDRAGLD